MGQSTTLGHSLQHIQVQRYAYNILTRNLSLVSREPSGMGIRILCFPSRVLLQKYPRNPAHLIGAPPRRSYIVFIIQVTQTKLILPRTSTDYNGNQHQDYFFSHPVSLNVSSHGPELLGIQIRKS